MNRQWGDMLFADFTVVGATGWIYWNMILDTTGGPWLVSPEHNDPDPNPQQPVLVADPATGQYWRTGCYYAMAHFGRFVPLGARRVGVSLSSSPTIKATAFVKQVTKGRHISCDVVLIAMNNSPTKVDVTLGLDAFTAPLTLPAVSFTTFIFSIPEFHC